MDNEGADQPVQPHRLISAFLSTSTQNTTVNSEIFLRVLFSRNFIYAKFRENKTLTNWRNHSLVY